MGYKRIYIRVPLSGEAVLSSSSNPTIKARTIDISQGGVAITAFSEKVPNAEYRIEILTENGQRIELTAQLVRVDDSTAGFQTLQIDRKSQEIIKSLVFDYQTTAAFLQQLEEFDLLDDKVVDEEGNEVEITFEKASKRKA